jgi:hypothetical protein
MMDARGEPLPRRVGEPPRTTEEDPHRQLTQNAPYHLQEALISRARLLPQTIVCPSLISAPGARGFVLDVPSPASNKGFIIGHEFAHLHPPDDGSLHMVMPTEYVKSVLSAGWGALHPVALAGIIPLNTIMVFGPRDDDELEVVWRLLVTSHEYAWAEAAGL